MKKLLHCLVIIIYIFIYNPDLKAQCIYNATCRCLMDAVTGKACINSIITAVPFLRINPDAKTGAMGDAAIAIDGVAGSMANNASMHAFNSYKTSVSATYSPWLNSPGIPNTFMAHLAGFTKIDAHQAIGLSARYFSILQNNSRSGSAPNHTKEFEITGAYLKRLSTHFSAAMGLKFIYSDLDAPLNIAGFDINPGKAVAADLSFTYRKLTEDGNFTLGFVLSDLGTKISYTKNNQEYIPAKIGLGASFTWLDSESQQFTFTGDLTKLMVPTPYAPSHPRYDLNQDQIPDFKQYNVISSWIKSFGDAPKGDSELRELIFSIGTEYTYRKLLSIRAGYFREDPTKGNRQYLTTGFGIDYHSFGINMSYLIPTAKSLVNRGPLPNMLRFALNYNFKTNEM